MTDEAVEVAVPPWAGALAPQRYVWMMLEVEAQLAPWGWSVEPDESGDLRGPDGAVLSLATLATSIRRLEDEEAVVDQVRRSCRVVSGEVPVGPEQLRVDALRVRLTNGYFPDTLDVVRREVLPGISLCVAFDLEDSIAFATRTELDRLGLDEEAAWRVGCDNTFAAVTLQRHASGALTLMHAEHYLGAWWVAPEHLTATPPALGLLIGLVGPELVVFMPIDDVAGFREAFPALVSVVHQLVEDVERPLGAIGWWYAGEWEPFHVVIEDERVVAEPGPRFLEAVLGVRVDGVGEA
jgi:hypothetical protein